MDSSIYPAANSTIYSPMINTPSLPLLIDTSFSDDKEDIPKNGINNGGIFDLGDITIT